MFINCNRYCLRRFTINEVPFLKITNYTDLQIYFILQYCSLSKFKTKQSPVFGRNTSQKLYFSENASNIAFNVINASSPSHDFICNRVLTVAKSSYFYIVETPSGTHCVER